MLVQSKVHQDRLVHREHKGSKVFQVALALLAPRAMMVLRGPSAHKAMLVQLALKAPRVTKVTKEFQAVPDSL
jgi:hypothetical protein